MSFGPFACLTTQLIHLCPQTLLGQNIYEPFWGECIGILVERIKRARRELESDPALPATLSHHEHSCFRECIDIVAKTRKVGYVGNEPLERPSDPFEATVAGRPRKRQKTTISTKTADTHETF